MSGSYARITACSYNLFHCPELSFRHGSTPAAEREARPGSEFLDKLAVSLRSFDAAVAYPPNQAFIGNIDPLELPRRPWAGNGSENSRASSVAAASGRFGDIIEEKAVLGLIKMSDSFDLVLLESGFAAEAKTSLKGLSALAGSDLSKFDEEVSINRIEEALDENALPLYFSSKIVGCVKSAHPEDVSLRSHVIFENLASKAGAVYSVLKLLELNSVDPGSVDYIIETSEEACGDANQRGGGNFAKAVGELAGLSNATGSDTRSFCAGPVHGILQAASLVKAGTFRRVIVAAGGATAKLAMNSKKHIEKGFPMLEDCLGSYAVLIDAGVSEREASSGDIIVRNDVVGVHRIGSGSSPQHVIQNLVADPLEKAGIRFDGIGYYAPELHNPEITEAGGAGNVTLANLKMIAAMAVMKKQIEREDINTFIEAHGSAGWAPTQGHIPSGIPALGWISEWMKSGRIRNAMVIGKGSLFLGRMTGLFDGVSILLESPESPAGVPAEAKVERKAVGRTPRQNSVIRVGLTVPGSESDADELLKGAADAEAKLDGLKVVAFGEPGSDPGEAQRMMEEALENREVDSAVTFHYPFPVGTATVGLVKCPGNGRDIFIASSTGVSDTNRVNALIRNTISGISAAKAWGIDNPSVGFLNLDGARKALNSLKKLRSRGYGISLAGSARGDELLRGNDILAGTVDVIVCDTLSGNAFIKLLACYETGGTLEVSGAGYGPGFGTGKAVPVSIISRASGASVVSEAILYSARMYSAGLSEIYRAELSSAEAAGMERILEENCSSAFQSGRVSASPAEPDAGGPAPVPVDTEIEGIDVLMLDDAVGLLKDSGIYCEAGMGCTGPVVMLAGADAEAAEALLREKGIIGEEL